MKQITALAGHVRHQIAETIPEDEAARALREAYMDDVIAYEKFRECQKTGPHRVCSDGDVLVKRCKLIDAGLQKGHFHQGDKWITDLPKVPPDCPNVQGIPEKGDLTLVQSATCNTSALGYRIQLGEGHPDGSSIRWRVLRPNSLNIQPKLGGARPEWAQLCDGNTNKKYIDNNGMTKGTLLSLCSNLFDPLLLTSPFIATARMLF